MNTANRTTNAECGTTNRPQFEAIGEGLLVRAPGKINLSLLVAGKRPDGFHNIESIMAKIEWYDEILIEQKTEYRRQNTEQKTEDPASPKGCAEAGGGQKTEDGTKNTEQRMQNIELICKGEYPVPEGEDNIVYKAAKLILDFGLRIADLNHGLTRINTDFQETENTEHRTEKTEGRTGGIRITLMKHIPAGSGLGSGSSDAAATLLGINKFFRMGLGKKELAGLAARIGSDVAFFLDGPTAFCTGKGEKVKKLEKCEFGVFLIIPNVSVSTARVYENYRHDESRYRRFKDEINVYIEKNRLDLICSLCANMLEENCFALHPELGILKKRIESLGIRPVCLSGSGSAMFCVINDRNRQPVVTYGGGFEREFGCKGIIVNNNAW